MTKMLLRAVVIGALLAAVPGTAAPVGPIVNGSFELAAPGKAEICSTAGEGTWVDVTPNRDPWLARVHPCEAGAVKALHWSTSSVTQYGDFDGDGDREASIDGSRPSFEGIGAGHNMWQAYPSPHQAFTGNFDAFRFSVESGEIPRSAAVVLSFSTSPLDTPSPFVGVYFNCDLTFGSLESDEDGQVSVDPASGNFRSRHSDCDAAATAWTSADEAGRRSILGRLRIVQVSFWGFETGDPLLLDDVEIAGARTVVEELAGITL
ncbi:MAG TPA: hypothetical protein VGB52_03300 [Actinomycetota bacterium]